MLANLPLPPAPVSVEFLAAFKEGLKEAGFVEGSNLALQVLWEPDVGKLPGHAVALADAKVDALVTFTTPATRAALDATRSIPIGVKCPKCAEGELTERRTKRGKSFFGCLRYPECDFSTWNRPVPETCPACGWVGMEKKSSKTHGDSLTCMKCGHKVLSEAEETADT